MQAIDDVLNIMRLIANDDWPFWHMTEHGNILRSKIEEVRREADGIDRILAIRGGLEREDA